MPFTIRLHQILPSYLKVEESYSDRTGYSKYIEQIGPEVKNFVVLKITLLSIATFGVYGIYFLISTNGKTDRANLKARIFVHYVAMMYQKPAAVSIPYTPSPQVIKTKLKSPAIKPLPTVIEMPKYSSDSNQEETGSHFPQHVTGFVKQMTTAHEIVILHGELLKLVQTKAGNLSIALEKLAEEDPHLSSFISEFLNRTHKNQPKHFLKDITSLLTDGQSQALIRKMIEKIKADPVHIKSDEEKNFESLQSAIVLLQAKNQWLDWHIFLFEEHSRLFQLVIELEEIHYFHNRFIQLLTKLGNGGFQSILNTMKQPFGNYAVKKKEMEGEFFKWKQLHEKFYKNIASELDPLNEYQVEYTLRHYIKSHLTGQELYKAFDAICAYNYIGSGFIQWFWKKNQEPTMPPLRNY